MVLGELMMADDGYEKVCKIKALLAECTVPPRESQFLNLDRFIEEGNGVTVIPDPPNWCNLSFRGFQERVLTFRPQHWGADPNAVLWLSKYGWQCTEKFVIKCDICSSTVECSSLIQKPDLWGDLAHKAHDNLCYWSFCPCPDRFIQIITHPKILCKNVCHNWKKIIVFGAQLPKIQQVLLDKMGLNEDLLEHLFRIIESSFSEEGLSALILVICGWLKSSEDKTLECAYCQRHLALRHFYSIEETSKIQDSASVQDDLCAVNEAEKMDVSETLADRSLSPETSGDSTLVNTTLNIESVRSLQPTKRERRGYPAFHMSTARHRARALSCVTKRKFPSFSNLLYLRYGVKFLQNKGPHKIKKCTGMKHSENDQNVKERSMTNGSESTCEKPPQELSYVDKDNGEQQHASVSNDTSLGNNVNKRKLPGDKDTESVEISHVDEQQKVTDVASEIGDNNSSTHKEVADSVPSVQQESDLEMGTSISTSQNAELDRTAIESNLPIGDQLTSTHELEGKVVSSSSSSMQNNVVSKSNEELTAEKGLGGDSNSGKEVNENEKTSAVSDSGKIGPNLGKRQLTCDGDQPTEGANKRLKIGSETSPLKKKDLNPIFEHRFWCIWRIKTVDRLLGSPKEGWRQILDLLKFGVSPQNSENEEEAGDLFEDVKKIHFMMSGW